MKFSQVYSKIKFVIMIMMIVSIKREDEDKEGGHGRIFYFFI